MTRAMVIEQFVASAVESLMAQANYAGGSTRGMFRGRGASKTLTEKGWKAWESIHGPAQVLCDFPGVSERVNDWLDTLGSRERELANLFLDPNTLDEAIADWVEEHGGQRNWGNYLVVE